MENKLTAVEWFSQEINKINVSTEARLFINKLKEQAKAIEKQQIIDAAERWKGTNFAEQYYKETYTND